MYSEVVCYQLLLVRRDSIKSVLINWNNHKFNWKINHCAISQVTHASISFLLHGSWAGWVVLKGDIYGLIQGTSSSAVRRQILLILYFLYIRCYCCSMMKTKFISTVSLWDYFILVICSRNRVPAWGSSKIHYLVPNPSNWYPFFHRLLTKLKNCNVGLSLHLLMWWLWPPSICCWILITCNSRYCLLLLT